MSNLEWTGYWAEAAGANSCGSRPRVDGQEDGQSEVDEQVATNHG